MKKYVIMIVVLLTITSCKTVNLDLRESYSKNNEMQLLNKVFLPNNTYANSIDIVNKGIDFKLGLNKENKIIFISTSDLNFEANGFKIESKIGEEINKKQIEHIQGWGKFMLLESGWYAGFEDRDTINKNSKIKWFFKFNFNESNAKFKI